MRMMDGERVARDASAGEGRGGWLATGGVVGALLASACCIGPLALLLLGVSGTWIGNLVALEPAKPVFAGIALVCIGLGFRRVYFRGPVACEMGSTCARPASAIVTETALWLATLLVLAALTIDWWAPFLS